MENKELTDMIEEIDKTPKKRPSRAKTQVSSTPEMSQLEKDNLILKEKLKQFELKEEKIRLEKELAEQEENSKEEKLRKDRDELISGVFDFREVPDGNLRFSFKKHKGDKVEKYLLHDKIRYALPKKVVHHLIKSGEYKSRESGMFEVGKPVREIKRKRYNFILDAFPDPNEDISKLPNGRPPKSSV